MKQVEFNNFSFSYPTGNQAVLSDITMTVQEGELLVICGRSGSGKSTLLRCIKDKVPNAAIVFQDPNGQLIHEKVLDNLVFQMENMGQGRELMRARAAETVGFFGIEAWLHLDASELSGGQKQLILLCAALMARPNLLLLDEPISQLDPIAARELLDMVARINRELGITVIICEHRLDDIVDIADRIMLMEEGRIAEMGDVGSTLLRMMDKFEKFVPDIPRASGLIQKDAALCLSTKQLRLIAGRPKEKSREASEKDVGSQGEQPFEKIRENVLEMQNVFFAYPNSEQFVLRHMRLEAKKGERICILGGNASGKSTLLKVMAGILKPDSGKVKKSGRVAYMPQDVRSFFRFETVREELMYSSRDGKIYEDILYKMGMGNLLGRHPFDLSGGEMEKLALCCLFMQKPDIILLDEPTKGLDPYAKEYMTELIKGTDATVICATHDIIFAAGFSDRCAMLFDGSISHSSEPTLFFRDMEYYTTPIGRTFKQWRKDILTVEDVKKAYV